MMAQSRAESTRDTCNYGQYINQFPQNTIKVIREFEWIQKKICRHKMSIMFNEICINEEMLPKYIYIYIIIWEHLISAKTNDILNWIVWNSAIYMYKNGFGINDLQWLMCHKTKPNLISVVYISLLLFTKLCWVWHTDHQLLRIWDQLLDKSFSF